MRMKAGCVPTVAARTMGPAVALSEGCERDRRVLSEHLAALAASYARDARRTIGDQPAAAELAARRHALVLEARDALERNASATLMRTRPPRSGR